jgi:hypothetical protein
MNNLNLDGDAPRESKKPWYNDGKYNLVIRLNPDDYADFKDFVKVNGVSQAKCLRTAIKEFLNSRGYVKKSIEAPQLKEEFMRLYEEEMERK